MENTQKFFDAQALSPWVDPANWLTSDEVIVERSYHRFLESLNRPKPSALALALVSVLAIPPANRGIGK